MTIDIDGMLAGANSSTEAVDTCLDLLGDADRPGAAKVERVRGLLNDVYHVLQRLARDLGDEQFRRDTHA